MKKAQNDVDFIPPIMNHTISGAQKYSSLFGYYQQLLLNNLGWRRALGMKRKFEVMDDPIDNFVIFDKEDHFHLSAALRTEKRICLIDFSDHLGPAPPEDKVALWDVGDAEGLASALKILLLTTRP